MVASGDRAGLAEAIDGPVAFFFCANDPAPVNPCGPDPEMLLTVTGASGTVNWCGQTWNLPADSGVEKSACPGSHGIVQTSGLTPYSTFTYWLAHETWKYTAATSTNLVLINQYRVVGSLGGTSYLLSGCTQSIGVQGTLSNQVFLGSGSARPVAPLFTSRTTGINPVLLSGQAAPTYSNYKIPDGFFGSHTAGGITYTWAKGAGW